MKKTSVLVVGGGVTGVGILRDLSMRGVETLLIEKKDLMNGASSRYHGLLHSGGRYAVKDAAAAHECIEENKILRRIGADCVEPAEGLFVRLSIDDADYEEQWVLGCKKSGIEAKKITPEEARRLEPRLTERIAAAYVVPDASIDGFRCAWQNVDSAKRYGGKVETYTELVEVLQENGRVKGARVRNTLTGAEYEIECQIIVNATGAWAGQIAARAGLNVGVQPDKGSLKVFHTRLVSHIVNRLHKSSDGDIFVPCGSVTILGTTSVSVDDPEDTRVTRAEVERLLSIGEEMIEDLRESRILRAFAGSRPLYLPAGGAKGRGASRGFAIIDHASEGLQGMLTIVGGKFTTYRLMAEKMSDRVCAMLGNNAPCRTAQEPLVEQVSGECKQYARQFFPSYGVERAAERLGKERFQKVTEVLQNEPDMRKLLCECENVTRAEAAVVAREDTIHSLSDLRRRTRIGMGTCQGNFCAMRNAALLAETGKGEPLNEIKKFIGERFKGVRPVLLGRALREVEMTRAIYELAFNIAGEKI